MGAACVHVYWGLLRATAEEARLREDSEAGEPLLPDAELALHWRVAVSDPQRPVVGGRRSEVPGVDVGRGVGRAQQCEPSVRQRMVKLCLLRNRAERLHCGGPQVEVAASTGDYELHVAGTRGRVLQGSVLGRRPVRLVQQTVGVVGGGSGKPKRVLGVLSAHGRAVLKLSQGHLVDHLRRAHGDSCGPLAIRVSQKVEDDLGVQRMDPQPVDAALQGEGGGHSHPVRHRARDGRCPCAGEVGGEGDTGGVPAGSVPRRVGGGVAPGLRDPVVPVGAEPTRVQVGGVPSDIGVAGGQLVYVQRPGVVGADCRVVVESDLSSGDRARPGPERCYVLSEPGRASALVHHQVSGVFRLVLQRVHRHVWVMWHLISHQQGGCAGESTGPGLACPHLHYHPLGPQLRLFRRSGALVARGHQPHALGSWCSPSASTSRRM